MSLTISADQVATLIADPSSISGYSASSHIIVSGAISHTDASLLNAVDATYIQATITTTSAANLAAIDDDNSTRAQTNRFAFVIDDTSATAEALNDVLAKTALSANFTTINEITASPAADVVSLYASDIVSGLGDENITLNDTTIDAASLNSINDDTTGDITIEATTIEGSTADLEIALTNAGTGVVAAGLTNIDVTVTSSTTTVDVDSLEDVLDDSIALGGTGVVSLASNVTTLEGNVAAALAVQTDVSTGEASADILALDFVLTDTTVAVGDINTLQGDVTGSITATITESTAATVTGLTGTGNAFTIALAENTLDADAIVDIAATTTETITITSTDGAQVINGTAGNILSVVNGDFTGIQDDFASTASGNTSVANANLINAATTGIVTATINETDIDTLTTLTASDNNLLTIVVSDRDATASELNTIADATNGAGGAGRLIDFSAVETITGTLAEVNTLLVTNEAEFTALHDEIDFTITSDSLEADTLNTIDGLVAGAGAGAGTLTVDASSLSGVVADVNTALASATITGIGADQAITLEGSDVGGVITLDIADVVTTVLDANTTTGALNDGASRTTTGVITIDSDVAAINGDYAELNLAQYYGLLDADSTDTFGTDTGVTTQVISGLAGLPMTIDDAVSLTNLNSLTSSYDIGVITATLDAAGAISDFTDADTGILESGNAISLTATGEAADATTVTAEDVLALQAITSGTITLDDGAGGNPTITGSLSDVSAVFTAGVTSADSSITLDDTGLVSAEDMVVVSAVTSAGAGTLTATGVTGLRGTASDVTTSVAQDAGFNTADLIITDAVLEVDDLNTIIGNDFANKVGVISSGDISVVSSVINGDDAGDGTLIAAAITLFGASANPELSDLGAINITGDTFTFAEVEDLNALTTGTITASVADSLVNAAALDADLSQALTITLTEDLIGASALTTLAGKTTGSISIDNALTITGGADDIEAIFDNDSITGLDDDEALVVTGSPSVTQVNTVAGLTSGDVTAAVTGDYAALSQITNSGNLSLTITVTGSVSSTELTALAALGDVTLDGSIAGTLDEINTSIANGEIDNAAASDYTISDSITVAELDTLLGTVTSGTITATISDQDTDTLAGIDRVGAYTITVANTTAEDPDTEAEELVEPVLATALTAINALTTETINVTSSTITGDIADVTTAFVTNNSDYTFASDVAITLDDATSIAELNAITDLTTGTVTATMDAAISLEDYVDTDGALTIASGNALTITLDDAAEVDAADVNTLIDATTVSINFSEAAPIITGTLQELTSIYTAHNLETSKVAGAGINAAVLTVNDEGSISASDLNALVDETTAAIAIDASVTAIEGTFEEVEEALNHDVTSGGTGIAANDLVARADILDADGEVETTAVAVTVTDSLAVADANTLDGLTNGVITATITETDIATLVTTGTGLTDGVDTNIFTITVDDAEITIANLTELATRTAGTVTVDSSSVITGALNADSAALVAALESEIITGITSVESSDANNSVDEVNTVTEATSTAVITATLTNESFTTDDADGNDLSDLTGTGNALTITVSDASADAAALNTLDLKTTVAITVSSTTITGALSDVTSLYSAGTAGTILSLGNEAVTLSDTGSVNASSLIELNRLTTGVITATGVTTVAGSLSEITDAYEANTAGTINGLGDEAISVTSASSLTSAQLATLEGFTTGAITVTVSDESQTATSLIALDADASEAVNASTISTLTGSAEDVNTVYDSDGITGLGDEAVTLSDTSIAASTLNTVDGNTTGTVDAGTVTTLTGSVEDVNSLYDSDEIVGLGDEAVTISDTSISASALNTLDGNTSGVIDASSLTTITGTGDDALTAFESAGISGLTFDASNYLASYTDLLAAFGDDLGIARVHYFDFGVDEGRSFDSFDEASYLASYSDLLAAYGTDTDSALIHYINYGYSEGRAVDTFDENSYLASNTSLIGTVTDAAAHYVSTGYAADLALDSFDEFSYIASYADLITAFETDGEAATQHYVEYGYAEGRSADSFDELAYIASHTDLIAAFGTDTVAAAKHYIEYGSTEGRTVTFDAGSYLAAHADLRVAFGTDEELATKHYIEYGSDEGRALT